MSAELRIDRSRAEGREIDGELVVYDLGTRSHLGGNRAAAVLWPLLVAGTAVDEMAAALRAEFGIGPELARADAEAFAGALRDRGLLIEGPSQARDH